MKLRAPATPLITVDPYFSVWSVNENLNYANTVHWTGKSNRLLGYVCIDGVNYCFLGYDQNAKKMPQTSLDINALSTLYTFENKKIKLNVRFMTPLLPDDLDTFTRPVSYMAVSYEKKCECVKEVKLSVKMGHEICLNLANKNAVEKEYLKLGDICAVKVGNKEQNVLNRSGDDIRIDWGYAYLCVVGGNTAECDNDYIAVEVPLTEGKDALVLFAYDDVCSLNYFGETLKSFWNKNGKDITDAIKEAANEYPRLVAKCDAFSEKLISDALLATDGDEKYAELLSLAYRQVMAAHKVAVDKNGEVLFISKECFSNGCAATVDVSYPSIPLFLIYNTELVKGMMRPIYKFAASDAWKYDFAPHDAGQYPLVTGQVYGLDKNTGELKYEMQMPVEECGNMIIMEANVALADGNADFALKNIDTLKCWCEYLIKYGDDPENQLCTDDFAGHLAHNCNLSLKAIMGIMGMSIIMKIAGNNSEAEKYRKIAEEKAKSFCERAKNPDGVSYRLAYDKPDTFSMKYNMIWDKIWGTGLFPVEMIEGEISSNLKTFNKYGMPLDTRADYTKSDWLVWTATLAKDNEIFSKFIAPLWQFYNDTYDRVPMTDWYDTIACNHLYFRNRTVQGGLYIKLLDYTEKLKNKY